MSDGLRERLAALASRLPKPVRAFGEIIKRTLDEFLEDGAPRLAAALAYYLLIAFAPLLLVAVTIAGALFERQEVRDQILTAASGAFGEAGATVADQVLTAVLASTQGAATVATVFGVLVALFGASAAFGQLQAALNIAWGVRPRPENFRHMLRRRGLAFLMVVIIGVLLIGAILLGSGFARLLAAIVPSFPGAHWVVEQLLSFVGATVLFAIVFTVLPDRRIDWRETIVGAAVTSLLFTVGSVALGTYLGRSSIASFYGAAGSFAVLLVWLYYTTQVFLFGAEFTHVWSARRRAQRIEASQESSGED